MRRWKALLCSALAASVAALATLTVVGPAGAQSNGGVRVMPLGDSITDGFNVPGGYRIDLWQKLVAGGYRIDFVGSQSNGPASLPDRDHQGHSGWTIAQIHANVIGWLQATNPRTVLLHIGTNDMYQNPNGADQRLAALVDRITATAPDAEVFVSTIIPFSGFDSQVRAYNAAIPGIVQSRAAAGRRVHLVDMYPALTTADLADGVHPNATGYGKMATVWFNALRAVPRSITEDTPSTSAPASPMPTTPLPISPRPPTTPPVTQPAGACTAVYRVVNSWGSGFQAEVTVRAGTAPLNGWTVRMTLPAGQTINNLWNGVNTGTSGAVSVRNAPYNGAVPANGATTFGYVADGTSSAAPGEVSCASP